MSPNIWVIVAIAVDANKLASAIIQGTAWAVAGGDGVCGEWKLGDEVYVEQNRKKQEKVHHFRKN